MKLLMESAPREHEKRTLSAHLECRDVFACAGLYLNPCEKQTSSHFVGPQILTEAISTKSRITVKLGHFRFYFFEKMYQCYCQHKGGCVYDVFRVQMCVSVMGERLRGIIKREVL